MDTLSTITVSLAFLGMFVLIVGYTIRDTRIGPCVIWAGVMCLLGLIGYNILVRLS